MSRYLSNEQREQTVGEAEVGKQWAMLLLMQGRLRLSAPSEEAVGDGGRKLDTGSVVAKDAESCVVVQKRVKDCCMTPVVAGATCCKRKTNGQVLATVSDQERDEMPLRCLRMH